MMRFVYARTCDPWARPTEIVVAGERERRDEVCQTRAKLAEALARLEAA
jgi:hypothetical protein